MPYTQHYPHRAGDYLYGIAPTPAEVYQRLTVNYSVKMRGVKWGPNGTRVKASDAMWKEPLKWNRQAGEFCAVSDDGVEQRPRVFCASLADVFEDWQGRIVDHQGNTLQVYWAAVTWLPCCSPATSRPWGRWTLAGGFTRIVKASSSGVSLGIATTPRRRSIGSS